MVVILAHLLGHSKFLTNFGHQKAAASDSTSVRKPKSKDKRMPSARVDKEPLYSDISPGLLMNRASNSLKRKKRLYENKLSLNKKSEDIKEVR